MRVVTADGLIRRVDSDHEPDLFWAVRGGGGSFGVVAEMEFELLPVGELAAGALVFPAARQGEVFRAWRRWAEDLPEEMTSIARVISLVNADGTDDGRIVRIEFVWLGPEESGRKMLAPLSDLDPLIDTFAPATPEDVAALHMDPPDPFPYAGEGQLLSGLDDKAIDGIVTVLGRDIGSPGYIYELRTLGGAIGRVHSGGGALNSLKAAYMSFAAAVTPDGDVERLVRARLERLRAVLESFDVGSLTTFSEAPSEPERLFAPLTLDRLRRIHSAVDPSGTIHPNHPLA